MIINGQEFQTIWVDDANSERIKIIDQQKLPYEFCIKTLCTFQDAFDAIRDMTVRGAPLIGVTAAYGMYLALLEYNQKEALQQYLINKAKLMKTARPTAVNLAYAVDSIMQVIQNSTDHIEAIKIAFQHANHLRQMEIDYCNAIGEYGFKIIDELSKTKSGEPVNILTHCNAGWLACIDWGTALAPIYKAHHKGIPVHVWVDETRPRNQGSKLTAFELQQEGVPHTVIPDNTGGHLMQHRMVDLVFVGSDRTTRRGDVCNKIGTYLKALAAKDNDIPFYVALPSSSIDFNINNGLTEIEIEQRNPDEVRYVEDNKQKVMLVPKNSPVANYGFDVTPAKLISGLITEKGICEANESGILSLFPSMKS